MKTTKSENFFSFLNLLRNFLSRCSQSNSKSRRSKTHSNYEARKDVQQPLLQ